MPTTDQILAVSIEARINRLEREMRKASAVVGKNFDGMEKRSKDAANKIENSFSGMAKRLGNIGKNMAAGFLGGLAAGGLMGITSRVSDVARGIAEIGDEAKRAGLGVEAFQELKYVAEQNRIGVDSLTDGIKELNLRADEFIVTGGGSAAEAFQRLGYDADTLKQKLADPSALFTEIIGKLGQLDRAAQIRIADEIFGGTGGERFVQLIEQGEAALNRTRQEAHELGLVIDSDLIDRADELDRAFNAVANTVGTALKSAIVDAASALASFMEQFRAFDEQTTAGLNTRLKEIGLKKLDLDNLIVGTQHRLDTGDDLFGINRGALESQIATSREQITNLVEQEREILAILESRAPAPMPASTPLEITVTGGNPALTPPSTPPASRSGSAGSMREQADAARDVIAALEGELRTLGMSDVEQRVHAELRRAGAGATDAQKASIRDLVMAIDAEGQAMQRMESAMDNAKGMAKDFLGGLIGDLRNGVDAATALANAFGRLADKMLDMALDSLIENLFGSLMGAGGGGLLGGLFGFKDGGVVEAATGGLIRGPSTGTSDSIPARLSDGEFIVNAAATRRNLDLLHAINRGEVAAFAAGGLAGDRPSSRAANDNRRPAANDNAPNITINAPVTVNANGGTPEQNADLAKRMARQMEGTMRTVVADEIRRQTRQGNTLNTRSR